ncbi:hypothetical protein HHI36_006663 [Cryptolaemus montrouzieri]|uniref:Uncharacterized protein n=1 Tax=Cryptolaemus montrouzieri TaxID=559131 RepID=A0ABD2NYJ7_9CUCU
MSNEEITKPQEKIFIPALAIAKPEPKTDRESQIQAIEAKLKLMEKRCTDELKINDTVATKTPIIAQFQHNKLSNKPNNSSVKTKIAEMRSKPYKKIHHRR